MSQKRTLFPNGAIKILLLVYALLFVTCGIVLFTNVIFGASKWDSLKLLTWADNVINLTRDAIVQPG